MTRMLGLAALLAFVLVAAGCGGGDDDEDGGAGVPTTAPSIQATTLENPADASGALRFQKDELTAPAGEITLVMENPSSVEHDISVKGDGIDEKGEVVGQGGASRVTVVISELGEYEFYCSVPGHEAAGMEGTLTVTG